MQLWASLPPGQSGDSGSQTLLAARSPGGAAFGPFCSLDKVLVSSSLGLILCSLGGYLTCSHLLTFLLKREKTTSTQQTAFLTLYNIYLNTLREANIIIYVYNKVKRDPNCCSGDTATCIYQTRCPVERKYIWTDRFLLAVSEMFISPAAWPGLCPGTVPVTGPRVLLPLQGTQTNPWERG